MTHATPEGTLRYARRLAESTAPNHFRPWPARATAQEQLMLSSLGMGTYTGEVDAATDAAYSDAAVQALRSGVNVIDCAINYRNMRSERAVGAAIRSLIETGEVQRDEVWIMTKGGFIPFDSGFPRYPHVYIRETYLDSGLLDPGDIVAGCHAIAPDYLRDQLDRSLSNLGLECVDVYFVHNIEQQLDEVDRPTFLQRAAGAFEMCEEAVAAGKVARYGVATWNGFRVPASFREHLSVEELVQLAAQVGGRDHHFRVIQLPYNLGMLEAALRPTQEMDGRPLSLLEAADQFDIAVVTSVPLLQRQILPSVPRSWQSQMPSLKTAAQRALQFVRSTPAVLAPLVGMKSPSHVRDNCQLTRVDPLDREQFQELLRDL